MSELEATGWFIAGALYGAAMVMLVRLAAMNGRREGE